MGITPDHDKALSSDPLTPGRPSIHELFRAAAKEAKVRCRAKGAVAVHDPGEDPSS
jgi:hypothetical protein